MPADKPVEFFSEEQKSLALDIKQRILSGEKIPLTELISFLGESRKVVASERKVRENKPTDVDFF